MPYIRPEDRVPFDEPLDILWAIIDQRGLSNGELNYLMTRLGQMYLRRHGTSYNTISDVIKAHECAKLEFYAVVARPYESMKAAQNGGVYE